MTRTGKCSNYAGCLVAYRNEEVRVETGEFVCPECKQPLNAASAGNKKRVTWSPVLYTAGAIVFVLVALSFWNQCRRVGNGVAPPTEPRSVPAVESAPTPPALSPEPPEPRVERAIPVQPSDREPIPGPRLNLDLRNEENKRVKADVLKRIDLMPTVSAKNKDSLYLSVERARRMGRLAAIPFASGKSSIGANETEALKREMQSEQIQQLVQDPTAVFVVLGYADTKGDEKQNLEISERRAKSVLDALRNRCGIVNIIHAVGMGGSALFDEQKTEKNRVAEIWAVLP